MAKSLVNQMSEDWDPDRYTDEYRSALMKLIDRKIASGGKALPAEGHPAKRATNVIDLAAVLQRSLSEAGKSKKSPRVRKRKAHAKAA
jgi:DNA end-binding protein Ku